jgi:tRNA U34 5-carboxymethylaminomethyl modifying GTPase MnmE/TrmE
LHGGRAVVAAVLAALSRIEGLRPAEAGEFTRRAFENGKLDLTAVEGLADLVMAETQGQRRQAFRQMKGLLGNRAEDWRARLIKALALVEARIDFSDEADVPQDLVKPALDIVRALAGEIEIALNDAHAGERLRDGLVVAIAGPPNAGKSTLLNRLAQREAAIVSPTPGTTRDVIEVHLDLGGYPVTLLDTAGIRATDDPVELEGVRRAQMRAASADLVLWVTDASAEASGGRPDEPAEAGPESANAAALSFQGRTEGWVPQSTPRPMDWAPSAAAPPSPYFSGAGAESKGVAGAFPPAGGGVPRPVGPAAAAQSGSSSASSRLSGGRPLADDMRQRGNFSGSSADPKGPAGALPPAGGGPLADVSQAENFSGSSVNPASALPPTGGGPMADVSQTGNFSGSSAEPKRPAGALPPTDGGPLADVDAAHPNAARHLSGSDPVIWLIRNKADLNSKNESELSSYDRSEPSLPQNTTIVNKGLPSRSESIVTSNELQFSLSALTGAGFDAVLRALADYAGAFLGGGEPALITRERHRRILTDTLAALRRALGESVAAREDLLAEDLLAEELRAAAQALGRLTGRVDVEDILDVIFRDFCIGK